MKPERKYVSKNGDLVEEYYWAGKLLAYKNHRLQDKPFDEVCNELDNIQGVSNEQPEG